ncbi:hypothetical protein [Natronococcus wangiae]|uniref:hypothetical protein n=1 Tax=Natronococcus wangiae TaxID=3068275 RepID=UPI00273F989D|nr:hypothetical protein [Natronococcus sp. AD5]
MALEAVGEVVDPLTQLLAVEGPLEIEFAVRRHLAAVERELRIPEFLVREDVRRLVGVRRSIGNAEFVADGGSLRCRVRLASVLPS